MSSKMAKSVLVMLVVASLYLFASLNCLDTSTLAANLIETEKNNSTSGKTTERRGNTKPMLISTSAVFHNNNETNSSSVWNLAHYSTIGVDHRDHLSSGPTLLAITIFVGFTLSGLFLLWRRYRYANREVICHYTTLNQEVTLSANDILSVETTDDHEFHLDMSDDTSASSSDDEELLR
ncbi:hypothetical protein OUZ56_023233 [Daphnia magna]|uniref:Uncharacterized protein n=1 Tax=Daphnia magna TaxID=35525 RepID=A0ABR0AYR2_9CRUS|nr:hypothetical protein OUZ56_023233 [Daphnia magna]